MTKLATGLLLVLQCFAQTPSVLNLSHDLVTHGIAKSNMAPNTPTLDSRPLFEAGVTYASQHGIATVLADRGNYYFLTQSDGNKHAKISISNVTVDLQYSDLYFANGNAEGVFCYPCSGVTFQNFTMDYLHLPFTQVTVTSVNPTARTISYQTIPGWPAPSTLNAYAVPGGNDYFLFVFRNSQQLRQTGKLSAADPFTGTTLQVTGTTPGSLAADLAAIQPGDTVAVTFRSGGGMLVFGGGSNDNVRNVSIYSSSGYGFNVFGVSNSTLDQLQVIPRPGTDRLVSTDADGIHISFSGANNVISNSTVERNLDDAFVLDGEWYATVSAPNSGATVTISTIQFNLVLTPGTSFDFIDITNGSVTGTAVATAISPASSGAPGQTLTLTLDHAINGLQAGFGVIPSDPSLRGGGSVIRGNLAHEGVSTRGIYLAGVKNVTATDNFIDTTSLSGILIGEDDVANYDFKTGPVSGLTIHNNVVNNSMEYGYPIASSVQMAAAINSYVTNLSFNYVTTTPDANFTITGNLVTNTIWSGIRVESLNGGTISGNTIINASQQPNDYITDVNSGETLAQLQAEFAQPVVIARSTGVTNTNNVTTGAIITSVSDASGGLRLAPGAIASAYGANLASTTAGAVTAVLPTSLGGASVTITDNTGTARQAGLFYASPGQINYLVPMGTAPGVARVTIGNAVGGTLIGTVAPGLFAANGNASGVAAANAVRVAANGTQTPVAVFQCGANGCVSTPMDLGAATDTLIVEFFGTGIAGFSSLSNVVAKVGGVPAQVLFAGATQSAGLDQVNVVIPASLAGAGEVPLILMVDGQTANVVTVYIK